MPRTHIIRLDDPHLLPFARSRLKAMRKLGSRFASQQFDVDGLTVKVRISGDDEYISISGGAGGLWILIKVKSREGSGGSATYRSKLFRIVGTKVSFMHGGQSAVSETSTTSRINGAPLHLAPQYVGDGSQEWPFAVSAPNDGFETTTIVANTTTTTHETDPAIVQFLPYGGSALLVALTAQQHSSNVTQYVKEVKGYGWTGTGYYWSYSLALSSTASSSVGNTVTLLWGAFSAIPGAPAGGGKRPKFRADLNTGGPKEADAWPFPSKWVLGGIGYKPANKGVLNYTSRLTDHWKHSLWRIKPSEPVPVTNGSPTVDWYSEAVLGTMNNTVGINVSGQNVFDVNGGFLYAMLPGGVALSKREYYRVNDDKLLMYRPAFSLTGEAALLHTFDPRTFDAVKDDAAFLQAMSPGYLSGQVVSYPDVRIDPPYTTCSVTIIADQKNTTTPGTRWGPQRKHTE